ncbi:MAG: amino acid permease [Candidatus Nanopelagicales bacterium]
MSGAAPTLVTAAERAEQRRTLSTRRVVFLVIAAAAPLAAMVGNVPLGLLRGNGNGLPMAFAIATVVLLCFSVGYSAMSRRVVNTGAFYTYIARGLGKPSGVSAGYVAVLSYTALSAGLVAAFGYFTQLVLIGAGVHTPWQAWSGVALLVVALLGYRSADLSAKILGTLMVAEFAILLVFDLSVGHSLGAAALPWSSFAPSTFLVPGFGIGMMFAFTSFVGFEASALYGEETHHPERSVPRSTYISVLSIGVFYVLTTWFIVGAGGADLARSMNPDKLGNLVFDLAEKYAGVWLQDVMAVFLCTSVLAALLAVHNVASRYVFALGREGVLPGAFGRYHPQHFSPHRGSIAVSVACGVALVAFAVADADPYTVFAAALIGLGTLGIVLLQAAAALAVIAYFWRRPDRSWWRCVMAPLIGFLGLTTGFVLAAIHYDLLTGSTDIFVNLVPLLFLVAVLAGVLVARHLRVRSPVRYHRLAESSLRRTSRTSARQTGITYSRKYCLIGAGPAGLVMARALLNEGVPFDWYERHAAIGGIWDRDNPGSPVYTSAHFISSKFISGFYGYPMPDELPDYPTWKQVRDYIRAFAARYGLAEHVTLGVGVEHVEPLPGNRWVVSLSTGENLEYDGVIAAPGVTWHPNVPVLAGQEGFVGEVRHSQTYDGPAELVGHRVLVVGAGNSGVDIVCDAARAADAAFLSVRRGYRYIPKHLFGLPTDALLTGYLDPPRGVSLSGDPTELLDHLVGDLTRFGLPPPDHELLQSHPIMNTQVLHHLAHGDLVAKPDVDHLTADGAVFTDGSRADVDLVLLATGYVNLLPFLPGDLFDWDRGHPQLYLNVFHRTLDSLYLVGLVEFADAAYKRFDEMAQAVVMDIHMRETGSKDADWRRRKHTATPDLRGGWKYIDSPRHVNYVDSHTYQVHLADLRDQFDWPDLDEHSYDGLLRGVRSRQNPGPSPESSPDPEVGSPAQDDTEQSGQTVSGWPTT